MIKICLFSFPCIQFILGKPIQCWIPQEFTRGWEEYAENYCWVSNTYFAPIQNRLPPAPDREMLLIGYYQWAPIVMAIQAMAFYLPCLIWRLFMAQSGFNVRRILQMACDSNVLLPEHTMKNVRFIARYMEGCIYRHTFRAGTDGSGTGWGCCGKRHGNYLVVLYFFIKVLYLTNIVGQLFMMEKFVGNNYTFYGLRVLIDLIKGREWFHSGNFPRVTFCDFEAKKLGKNHKYTLQCVLPLNMFLEKIYIFLWFWHCMVGLVTLSSFIMWFYRMGFPNRRVKFIRKYLKIMSVLRDTDKAASHKFVENYLRPDGVFLIRLIAINVGDLMAGDLACELWHIYRHKRLHEAEDQKYLDATGMLTDFVLPYEPGAPGAGDIPLNVAGRMVDKHPVPSAPLTSANNNNNNLSSSNNNNNNNDDSIV
ncbi:unnamed protein product [Echinostoma caproni]|uniref:Innexin n=1 Tax=Echinostoma caproni TaxID=27848 RepID=A0A3P8HMG7_9TREM|nr:unnamed protein product [Echinostoma caproni]